MTSIVWFRRDLRTEDNDALAAAAADGPVVPVFISSPAEKAEWSAGSAARVWLHDSLADLDRQLRGFGSRLIIRAGPPADALAALARQLRARAIHWTRCYTPHDRAIDREVLARLDRLGVRACVHGGSLLFEPEDVRTGQGRTYKVFTPFWKTARSLGKPPAPVPAPRGLGRPKRWPKSETLDSLRFVPDLDWPGSIRQAWTDSPDQRLRQFIREGLREYSANRDRPADDATSRLSPYLAVGRLGPRQVWHAVRSAAEGDRRLNRGADAFLRQLGWREFAYHVLFHNPHTASEPLRPEFADFPWEYDRRKLKEWQAGRTGYPLVDAGMRQLWQTGWMHNRVRMAVSSFLVKDLRLHWLEGARWFWDTLVDADLANNTLGWQWSAGCGADAAPYLRILNPVLQGQRFDPRGDYVRRWVPELSRVPDKWIHWPWQAPTEVLRGAGVRIGQDYPGPIVDHATARREALAAFDLVRRRTPGRPATNQF